MKKSVVSVKAFTLLELLAIIAVVALLVCIRLPALARVKTQTYIAQCSGNLRQVTLSFALYGADKSDRLPTSNAGFWPWDLPDYVYQQTLKPYGAAQTNVYYCPSNPYQNSLWNFGGGPLGAIHVTGYAYTFPGIGTSGGGLIASNYNPTMTPQQQQVAPGVFAVPVAAQRVLVADAELCAGPGPYDPTQPLTGYNFTDVIGGAGPFPDGRHHRASHLAGKSPLGGNLGMLDGHVEWRPFRSPAYNMIQRNSPAPNGTPCFIW